MASHNSQHDNNASDIGIPVWGTHQRDIKARKILCVMEHFGPLIPTGAKWVDLGCGSGGIAVALAPHVGEIIGVDPEPWPQWQELSARASNLRFITQSTEKISLPDACADVVICNQVYEHVPDPQLLIRQIYRYSQAWRLLLFCRTESAFPNRTACLLAFCSLAPETIRGASHEAVRGEKGDRCELCQLLETNEVAFCICSKKCIAGNPG